MEEPALLPRMTLAFHKYTLQSLLLVVFGCFQRQLFIQSYQSTQMATVQAASQVVMQRLKTLSVFLYICLQAANRRFCFFSCIRLNSNSCRTAQEGKSPFMIPVNNLLRTG